MIRNQMNVVLISLLFKLLFHGSTLPQYRPFLQGLKPQTRALAVTRKAPTAHEE